MKITDPLDTIASAISYLGSFGWSQAQSGGQTIQREVVEVIREFYMPPVSRALVRIAGLSGGMAVMIGAYGAHGENCDYVCSQT